MTSTQEMDPIPSVLLDTGEETGWDLTLTKALIGQLRTLMLTRTIIMTVSFKEPRWDGHEGDLQQPGSQAPVHRSVRTHLGPPPSLQVVTTR